MTKAPGRGRPAAAGRRPDHGMVTAETAVTLPAIAVVLVAGLIGVSTMAAQLRCLDAAAVAARLAARGEPLPVVQAAARAAAPAGSVVALSPAGAGSVRVEVTARVRLPAGWLAQVVPAVRAGVVTPLEPGVTAP